MVSGKPLLFVDYDDDGKLFINPAAEDLLTTFKEQIAIIGVMGISGEGKSFTLNQFLHRNDGFKVASDIDPCTQGMWLWNALLPQASGHKVLLLDCEGFSIHSERGRARRHLFYLSLLLSSIIIHIQIGGHIRPHTFARLSFLTQLSAEISVRETQREAETSQQESSSDFGSVFPTLIWLIHDFNEDKLQQQTPDQHLHEALMDVVGSDINKIRKIIKEFFPVMHCCTLPLPSISEAHLQQLDRVSYDTMRPTYKEKRDKFVEFVLRKTNPKMVDGMVLTGPMLVGITRQFIDAFNYNVVPVISLIWKSVQDDINQQTRVLACGLEVYMTIFKTRLGEIVQQHEVQSNEFAIEDAAWARDARVSFQAGLQNAHDEAFVAALAYVDTVDLGSSRLGCISRLKELMQAKYTHASRV